MIAATHPQQETSIMGKAIGQPVNEFRARQTNSKKSSSHIRILERPTNLIQTSIGHFGIDVQKPEHISPCYFCSGIQLLCSSAAGLQQTITKSFGQFSCLIRAAAIDNDDLCIRCALSQLAKERLNQRSFVEHRSNDRDQYLGTINVILLFGLPSW
jgi:hypothetical protein